MPIQNINGSTPNDGRGTKLRLAADYINNNFAYVLSLISAKLNTSDYNADSLVLAALNSAKSYTDSLVLTTLNSAKSYSDSLAFGRFSFIEVTKSCVGTVPFLATEVTLLAGTYTQVSANIGTNSPTDTAYCVVAKLDGTVLKTLSKTGIPNGNVITTGFTLATDTVVSFSFYGSSSTTVSYIFSIGVK
ncbi:MAG: hypothetical protein RIR39_2101 [Pseudomonadota bacterium]